MKFLKVSMYVFIGVIAWFLLLGLMQAFGWTYPSTGMIVTTVVLFVFAAINVLGMFGQRFRLKNIGFYLLHAGIVVFLLGCFVFSVSGVSGYASVDVNRTTSTIRITEGASARDYSLGFQIGYTRMAIETTPYYVVFNAAGEAVGDPVYARGDGDSAVFDFGKYDKKITVGECRVGSTLKQLTFGGAYAGYYATASSSVSRYEADFLIKDGQDSIRTTIEVNKTVRYRGWKIYLMSTQNGASATFLVKKDPGEPISIIGIVLMIAGVFYSCIIKGFLEHRPEPPEPPVLDRTGSGAKGPRAARRREGGK